MKGILQRVLDWRQVAPTFSWGLEQGLKFEGWSDMTPKRAEDGSIDYGATASRQSAVAASYFKQALSPDLALIGGATGLKAAKRSTPLAVGAAAFLGAAGVVGDVVEAVPMAVLGGIYAVTSLLNGRRARANQKSATEATPDNTAK